MIEGVIEVSGWTAVDVLAILRVALWFRDYGIVGLLVEVLDQFVDFRCQLAAGLAARRIEIGWA